jgi:Fe-S-cluster containining protein
MTAPPSNSAETVTVEFAVSIGDGKFTAKAIVPAGPTNLTQILPVLQSLDNSLIQGATGQLADAGQIVSCKAGCGACCRQLVPLTIFEAEALATWIRTLPEARQQELAERFHQALLKISAAGLIDRMVDETWFLDSETASELSLDYLYARVACPFLENEACSIYAIRPLVCREYLVTSTPEHCYDPATLQVEPVELPLRFSRILNAMGAELEHETRGWIPLLFLFAWMKADVHPGDAFSGPGPKVLYEFVKRIEQGKPIALRSERSPRHEPPAQN